MEFIYVSNHKTNIKQSYFTTVGDALCNNFPENVTFDNYNTIKQGKCFLLGSKYKYWGIFVQNKDKIIGSSFVIQYKEDNKNICYLEGININDEINNKTDLYEQILNHTIIKYEGLKIKPDYIRMIIENENYVKSILKIFKKNNFNVKTYEIDNYKEQNIHKLKDVSPQEIIDIEQTFIDNNIDIWKILFFEKIT